MGLYENIKSLCDQHGIAVTRLESELGFARGSIGKLRRQKSMKGVVNGENENFFTFFKFFASKKGHAHC